MPKKKSLSASPETVSKTTSDHEVIKNWVEAREGVPASVAATKGKGEIGLLRIKFPRTSKSPQNLDEISWDDFFKKFDENHLKLLYQEKTKTGELSRFFKFVKG